MTERLSCDEIRSRLRGEGACFRLAVSDTVTSTNAIARQLAADGAEEGLVVVASAQTESRVRCLMLPPRR